MTRASLAAALLGALCAPGCASAPAPDRPAARPILVDASGGAPAAPGDTALTPDALLDRVDDLLAARRRLSAAILVARHPEAARAAIAEAPSGKVGDVKVATAESLGAKRPALAFTRTVHARATGATLEAPPPALTLARKEGLRLLEDGTPEEAARALLEGAALAAPALPEEEAQLRLLASEALHRSGEPDRAREEWARALAIAAPRAARGLTLRDPSLWERALALRPPGAPWPEEVRALALRLAPPPRARATTAPSPPPPVEAALRLGIGRARLDRGERQGALESLMRAEALSPDEDLALELRLAVARALARLGETVAAQSRLAGIAARPGTPASRRVLALQGALELKVGDARRAQALLRAALAPEGGFDGPDRADAEANLGLACLTLGEDAEGLRRVRAGALRHENEGRPGLVVQCVRNELRFLETAGRAEEAEQARVRLDRLEALESP